MVTFICDVCQDTLKKSKVRTHNCNSDSFSCVDCNKHFSFEQTKSHNTCVSEAEKYERSLYKGKRKADDISEDNNVVEQKKKEEREKKKARQEQKKEEESKANLTIKISENIVDMISKKPITLRALKKKLVKEHNLSDEEIYQAMFAVARKITLSSENDDEE